MTLIHTMFTDDYAALDLDVPVVSSLDVFLSGALSADLPDAQGGSYTLFTHCTESAADPKVSARWVEIFDRFGLRLDAMQTGCCGMAGTFGHEAAKQGMSEHLFDLSWRNKVDAATSPVLATGFSCRCQVERFVGARPRHPVEVLGKIFCPAW